MHPRRQRRAECALHLLCGDRETWVELAASEGRPGDLQVFLRYLSIAHGWPTEPGRVDGVIDATVENATRGFQAEYNAAFEQDIVVDGVIGRETLGAFFDIQEHELRHQLAVLGISDAAASPRHLGGVTVLGAGDRIGPHPALFDASTSEGQRRVDLLLLDETVGWHPPAPIDRLYDAARFEIQPLDPGTQRPGDIIIRVVDHYGQPYRRKRYVLITDQERREGTTADDGLLVEPAMSGRLPRLQCDRAVVIVDGAFTSAAVARFNAKPPADAGEDDEEFSSRTSSRSTRSLSWKPPHK